MGEEESKSAVQVFTDIKNYTHFRGRLFQYVQMIKKNPHFAPLNLDASPGSKQI